MLQNTKHKIFVIISLILLFSPNFAWANPFISDRASWGITILSLLTEGIVLNILVRRSKPYFWRLFLIWSFVTFSTFFFLVLWFSPHLHIWLAHYFYPNWKEVVRHSYQTNPIPDKWIIIFSESIIVVTEALIMIKILKLEAIVRDSNFVVSIKNAFLFSLIINIVSYYSGFVFLDLYLRFFW